MSELHHNHFFDLQNFQHAELFRDCEYVWEALTKITNYIKSHPVGIYTEIPDGVTFENEHEISIGEGTKVEAGAYIVGPCIIGKNCEIRRGAYIRGNFICGDNCVVGSEVKGSIFLNKAKAPHFNYVGDSILGNRVNLGAGTMTANLRFDNRTVRVHHDGRYVDTKLKKLGAVCGDLSQSGCNSVMNPGTFLGKGAMVGPGVVATGFIEANHTYREEKKIIDVSHV